MALASGKIDGNLLQMDNNGVLRLSRTHDCTSDLVYSYTTLISQERVIEVNDIFTIQVNKNNNVADVSTKALM